MSHDATPTRSSPAVIWIASVLAVLLLYVATWPVVEIKANPDKIIVSLELGRDEWVRVNPPWINVLYHPMHFLRDLNRGDNFVVRYFEWWEKMLG